MTVISFEADNADPTWAIHAFQRSMDKVRSLGLVPRTEHVLAEHLFRGEANLLFYSSANGVMSLILDDSDLADDDPFEFIMFVMERRKKHHAEKRRAAKAIEAIAKHFASAGQDQKASDNG